jgi:L-malate glycosyltransferase
VRLTELLTNEDLRAKIAAAARKTAETRFCTDLIIPQYEAYYERVCNGLGTPQSEAVST